MSLPAIFTVYGGKELRDFLNTPFLREVSRKPWPSPTKHYTNALFNSEKNPAFMYTEAERFIARELITPKGRIAAFLDNARNARLGLKRGCFGYFDLVDDEDVARALMRPALGWMRERGIDEAVGPLGLNPLWYAGLQPDAPAHYARLIESQGFEPYAQGAFGFIDIHADIPPAPDGVEVSHADKADPGPDIKRMCSIYYDYAGRSLPLDATPEGLAYIWKLTFRLVGLGNMVFAHSGGSPVGAAVVMPDPMPVFRAMRGKILPFGWLKYMIMTVKTGRMVVLGPFGPDIPAAMRALMPEIFRISRDLGADGVVFHDPEGDNGPVMAETSRFSPLVSPGYTVYRKQLA